MVLVFKLYQRLEDDFDGIRQKFKEFIEQEGIKLIKEKRADLDKLKSSENDYKKYLADPNVKRI